MVQVVDWEVPLKSIVTVPESEFTELTATQSVVAPAAFAGAASITWTSVITVASEINDAMNFLIMIFEQPPHLKFH